MASSDRHDIVPSSGTEDVTAHIAGRPPAQVAPIEHERPEDWGWHHEWRRIAPLVGWAMTIVMVLLIFGNHRGNIENYWLIGLAAVMAAVLIREQIKRRNSWRP